MDKDKTNKKTIEQSLTELADYCERKGIYNVLKEMKELGMVEYQFKDGKLSRTDKK